MVFEAVLLEVVNKYIGHYVENLNSDQLKVGIWGGNVVVDNLAIRPGALDDLDLPVKTVFGHLGKLTLQIPWKDLYNSPVKVEVERLYVLVVPNSDIKYDPQKDRKYRLDEKMAEVKKVEKAKKLAQEQANPTQSQPSTFTEKLTANIIKNVQITLKDIHLRFEDKFSSPGKPYAAGITLDLLQVTSIPQWGDDVPCDPINLIFKQLLISSFSVYWNSKGDQLYSDNVSDCLMRFSSRLDQREENQKKYQYMLGPINSTTLLRYNSKPEHEKCHFTVPKCLLVSDFKELSLSVNKSQFQDIMSFIEGLEMMRRAGLYRKYRPDVGSYKGYYRQWWKFAYTCVVEEEVKRKLRNWDWNHIKQHLDNCRKYHEAYLAKMSTTKPTPAQVTACEQLEEQLDALNIILIRQRVELELERQELLKAKSPPKSGWFGGWWGGSAADKTSDTDEEKLVDKLENAMTSEEKMKLYRAIGYKEGDVPLEYPPEFVEFCFRITLESLSINVLDNSVPHIYRKVLLLSLSGVKTDIDIRPTSLSAATSVRLFTVLGAEQHGTIPRLVSVYERNRKALTSGTSEPNLLEVCFDQNPLDSASDTRVVVKAEPLLVIFDAKTIIDIQDVFDTSKPIAATQIQQAVQMKLTEIKTMSATGLQHMVTERKIVELDVDLKASTLILPENGFYKRDEGSMLVVSLGNINVTSNPQDRGRVSERFKAPFDGHPDFMKLLNQCYDNYNIKLTDLQVVYALQGEEWEETEGSLPNIMYFLKPSSLTVVVQKCIIQDDPRIPQCKIKGSLDRIDIILSEARLQSCAKLIVSIPLKESKQSFTSTVDEMPIFDSTLSMTMALNQETHRPIKPKNVSEELHQFKELELEFKIHEITSSIVDEKEDEFVYFRLHSLGVTVTKNTFDQHVLAQLGGVHLKQNFGRRVIHVIDTPPSPGKEYLFSVELIMVDRQCPDFRSRYASTLQNIMVDFTHLEVSAHAEAILDLLKRVNEFTQIFDAKRSADSTVTVKTTSRDHRRSSRALPRNVTLATVKTGKLSNVSGKSRMDVIDMKVNVRIGGIVIKLENKRKAIMRLAVKGGETNVVMRKAYTMVEFNLNGIEVINLECDNLYSKVISQVDESKAFKTTIVIFNAEEYSPADVDLKITAEIARIRVVYLNAFVTSVLDFLDNFQTAQQRIYEASQAAAEVAKQNVQEAYSNAAKAELSIDLKAPVIFVPISSRVKDVFIIDLGYLNISNIIVEIKCKDDQVAALDRIKLNLDEMKLTKAVINEDFSLVEAHTCEIIERVSFKLTVQRNLSSGWYTDIPDLELLCEIPAIKIHVNRKNYLLLMQMLEENIGAPPEEPSNRESSNTKSISDSKSTSKVTPSVSSQQSHLIAAIVEYDEEPTVGAVVKPTAPPLVVRTSVKFSVSLESVIIDVGLPTQEETTELLARLTLLVLSLRGSLLSDGSIQTSILLLDLSLDDLRQSRNNKINCYMSRKGTEEHDSSSRVLAEPSRNVLDVVYQQTKNATFANIRISSFILILNVEYLTQIASVFSMPSSNSPVPAPVPQKKSSDRPQAIQPKPSKASVRSVENATAESSEKILNFNFKCEQPDIIVVEHMDDIETNAIIVHAEVEVKGRYQDDKQFISGSITDLQLFSCCFNPVKRAKTKVPVLRPFSVILAGSTLEKPGLNLDICTTAISLSVSPGIIGLLSNISSAMSVKVEVDESLSVQETDRSKMWAMSDVNDSDYNFLTPVEAEEALIYQANQTLELDSWVEEEKCDTCSLTVPSIVITLDSGIGKNTMPLFKLDSKIQGTIRQWSTRPGLDCQLFVQISYYNHRLALWEPVLEPVETKDSEGREIFVPWELHVQLETIKDVSADDTLESPTAADPDDAPHYVQKITVSSKDFVPITITKTCLDVITDLSNSFQEAYLHPTEFEGEKPAFVVRNDTGYDILVFLTQSDFKPWGIEDSEHIDEAIVNSGGILELQPVMRRAEKGKKEIKTPNMLNISIPDLHFSPSLPISRADKRYFATNTRGYSNDFFALVSDVSVENGCTYVTLRSIIQIRNKFSVPVSVYYMTKKGNELELVGVVEPKGILNLPLDAVYTPTCELFFSVQNYSVSLQPFVWKDLQKSLEKSMLMRCDPKRLEDKEPFFIRASGELEQVYYENSMRHTMASACYNIYIRPTVIFKNLLPVDVVCSIQGMVTEPTVEKGGSIQVLTAEPGSSTIVVRIPDYLNREWVCKHQIEDEGPELVVWTFETFETTQKFTLELGLHTLKKNETVIMELYCPFWMLNKTGLLLSYKRSSKADKEIGDSSEQALNMEHVLYHPADFVGPIMFSFRAKSFFAKKKSQIRVDNGQWSDKFSLDVVGSSGSVSCVNKNMKYEIGIAIQLSYSTLTKIVVFTPFFIVSNNWPIDLEFQEVSGYPTVSDPWFLVGKTSCIPFWPVEKEHKGLKVRVAGTEESTVIFPYNTVFNGLFKLENKYGAVNVDVQITEGGTYISFHVYETGLAPALIINHSSHEVLYQEKALKKETPMKLPPHKKILFTWESKVVENGLLVGMNKLSEIKFKQDNIGKLEFNKEEIYWVSFLYGLQRVLLFTSNQSVAKDAQNIVSNDPTESEIEIQINGISLSLVDNVNKVEVLHLAITSTGVIWQSRKKGKKRFKPLSDRESHAIEAAYQDRKDNMIPLATRVDNRIQVDFANMVMTRPVVRELRRAYKTGLWISIVSSRHILQFHLKINRIQIDNQMFECVFPVVLAPVPPPRTVSADIAEKPFVEVSIVKRLTDYSVVQQFKYFKVLVQEFQIKVDTGFISALLSLVEKDEGYNEKAEATGFRNDLKLKDEPLQYHVLTVAIQDQKHFYDYLHLSPLKFHLSFTLSGQTLDATNTAFVGTLLQSFGVTLTDIQGVVFKLAYFEKEHCFLTRRQLLQDVQTHYASQLIKQLYVLVLGLDVIGNPLGLMVGFGHGAKDLFYEPFQGAIQGPGEFATGLAYGMRSLLGHTVGGAAGAVSKITGAMGKGLAALTFDKEYQKDRLEMYSQQPANLQEGLAQSGKGLVLGMYHGVTGVVTKPISGAKTEGFSGFLKGTGKGLVGLVTRPTAGLVDFASGSFNAVKRATDISDDTTRMRPPRFIQHDGHIRPFSKRVAEGHKLLKDIDKGKYATTDVYAFHTKIGQNGQDFLLITDKRIGYVCVNEIFGGFQMDWCHTWSELDGPPAIVPNGIKISVGKKKGVMRSVFQSSHHAKILLIESQETRKQIVDLITEFMSESTGAESRTSIGSSENPLVSPD